MSIDRYDCATEYDFRGGHYGVMMSDPNGDYVKYEDVESLLATIKDLREEIEAAIDLGEIKYLRQALIKTQSYE